MSMVPERSHVEEASNGTTEAEAFLQQRLALLANFAARAWWDDNRGKIPSLRKSVQVDGSGRTVAVDLQAREI